MEIKHFKIVFCCAILFLLCIHATSVFAHAGLIESIPRNGETVKRAPEQISLRFTETLEQDLVSIRLFDWNGKEVSIEKPRLQRGDASEVNAKLPALQDGTYTVVWSVVSEDGHPAQDTTLFSIGTPSAAVQKPIGEKSSPPANIVLIICRYLTQGIILLMGGLALTAWRAQKFGMPSFAEILGKGKTFSWLLPLFGMMMLWFLYEASLPGVNLADALLHGKRGLLGQSPFAVMLLVSMLFLFLLAIPTMEAGWYIVMWLLLVATQAFGGHVWGIKPIGLSIIARVLHVLSVSLWLGALLYLFLTSWRGKRENASFKAFFLRTVAIAAGFTLVSGVMLLLIQTDAASIVTSPATWSYLLFGKTAVVVVMLLLAWRQTRRWRNGNALSQALLRWEAICGLFAILAGIWMSQTQYPTAIPSHVHYHVEYKQGESE